MPTAGTTSSIRAFYWPTLRRTCFAAVLCMALFVNFMVVAGHDQQRLVEVGTLLVAAGIALSTHRTATGQVFPGVSGKALSAFFVLGALSTVQAFSTRFAAFEVANFFLLYLFAAMIAAEIARGGKQAILLVLRLMGAACAPYIFLFIVAYVGALHLGNPFALNDFTTNFSNIRFFNHTQTSTLPLLILLCCLTPRASRLRWLGLAVTTYWWMALFATMGRGTLLGMAAGCVVVAVLARRRAASYLRQVALTAALGLLAYVIFLIAVPALLGVEGMQSFSSAIERTAADPTSGRTLLWHLALALIAQHPWLGVGPMHFAHHAGYLHIGAHPHDVLLQVAAEWGLPALLCLLIAVVLGLRALLRTGARIRVDDTDNQAIFSALLVGAVAILVDGLVSGSFVMPQSQLAIALFLGCAIGWQRSLSPATPATTPHGFWRAAGAALVAAAMAGVVAGVGPDALAKWRGEDLTPAQQALNTGDVWPRLWKAGFF